MAKKTSSNQKRRVKNPETFRERALKAAESGDKPKRLSGVKRQAGKVAQPILRPAGKAVGQAAKFKPFRVVGKLLRLIGRIIFPVYFRNSWRELKQVTWPSWKQSRQLTFAVIVFAAIFGAVIALVDFGLDKLFKQVLLK